LGKDKRQQPQNQGPTIKMYQDGQPLSDEETHRLFGKRKFANPPLPAQEQILKKQFYDRMQARVRKAQDANLMSQPNPNCQTVLSPSPSESTSSIAGGF